MRRLSFSWIIVMVALILVIFVIAAKPAMTGYSIMSQYITNAKTNAHSVPIYMYTLIALIILLVFSAFVVVGINFHAKKTRLNEEDSIKELIKNIK